MKKLIGVLLLIPFIVFLVGTVGACLFLAPGPTLCFAFFVIMSITGLDLLFCEEDEKK